MKAKLIRTLTAAAVVLTAACTGAVGASAFSGSDITNGHTVGAAGSWISGSEADVPMTDPDGDGVWEGRVSIDSVEEGMLTDGSLNFLVRLDGGSEYCWGNYSDEAKATLGGAPVTVPAEAGKPLEMKVELNTNMKTFYYTEKTYEELGEEAYKLWPVFYTKLITGLDISDEKLSLKSGETSSLTAAYYPTDARNNSLVWASSDTSVVTVDAKGAITAKAAGTATVTVRSDNGKEASCEVTVTETLPTAVKLDKTAVSLDKGNTLQLKATVTPADAKQTVSWTSSAPSVATVNQSGKITAKAGGKATITAKTANGLSAACTVTVYTAPTAVKLDKTTLTVNKGGRYTFKPTLSGTNAKTTYKWTSSDTSVVTVSTSGAIYAHKGGKATIKVTTANNLTASCVVTVKVDPTGVTLSKTSLTMGVGDTTTLKGTVAPSDATTKTLTWSTSDKSVVTVKNGKLTAKKAGTATVTAKTSNGKKTTCKVTVKKQPTKITLNKTKLNLETDKTATLKVTLTPSNAYKSLKWSTSDKSIVTVKDGKLTPKKTGTATITVKTSNGKKATCKVTVKKPDYMKRLKDKISKSSKKDSDGNRYITLTDSNANTKFTTRITYDKKKDKLRVKATMSTKGTGYYDLDATIKFDLGSTIKPKVTYKHPTSPVFSFESTTSSKLSVSSLTKSSNPAWNITKTTGISYLSASDRKDFGTASSYLLHSAIYTLDYITEEKAGITIKQLGFKNYTIDGNGPNL